MPDGYWQFGAERNVRIRKAAGMLKLDYQMLAKAFELNQLKYSRSPPELQAGFVTQVKSTLSMPEAVERALELAEDGNWMLELAKDLAPFARENSQKFLDEVLGAGRATPSAAQAAPKAAQFQVCMIESSERGALGTGSLISPYLVLTAYHVVADHVSADGEINSKVSVRFMRDDSEPPQSTGAPSQLVVSVVEGKLPLWKAVANEVAGMAMSARFAELLQNLDVAVLRLASPVGAARGWMQCRAVVRDTTFWLHHCPTGAPIEINQGLVERVLLHDRPARIYYKIPSDPTRRGSSGGPCIDESGHIVGIHQARFERPVGVEIMLRGAPGSTIDGAFDDPLRAEIMPTQPPPLWWVRNELGLTSLHAFRQRRRGDGAFFEPLIGRHELQERIWKASQARDGSDKVFIVTGPPRSGVSTTVRILKTMLNERDHVVASVDVSTASYEARNLAAHLHDAFLTKIGAIDDDDTVLKLAGGSGRYDQELEVAKHWIDRINRKRGDRMVWLVIDGFDAHSAKALSDRLILEALAQMTRERERDESTQESRERKWLRLVFLGVDPPKEKAGVYEEFVQLPNVDELTYYLARRLRAAGLGASPDKIAAWARETFKLATDAAGGQSPTASELCLTAKSFFGDALETKDIDGTIVDLILDPCW